MAGEASGMKSLGSSGVLYDERRDFYIRPNVVKELWSDVAPFLTVVANQSTISGMADPTFKMFEHRNPWQKQELVLDGADSVGSASGVAIGTNLIGLECEVWSASYAEKKGVILITSCDASGDNLTKKDLSSDAVSLADTDILVVVGNAQAEGSRSPKAWSDELEVVYNSTQIFKTPLQITGTLLQASLRGESKELARLRDQKSAEHKIQKERAFLFGSNPKGIKGGFADIEAVSNDDGVVRSTMGIIPALEKHGADSGYGQNVFKSTEINEYGKFVDAMEKVFQYVPTAGMKRAFVGAGALGYFSKQGTDATANDGAWAKEGGWTVNLGDMKRDTLGFNYRVLETPHGMIQMIPTPALRGPYNKHMIIVDEDNLFHAQYRAPQFQASIQENDADYVKDQYFSDEGIGISMIESHSLMVTP